MPRQEGKHLRLFSLPPGNVYSLGQSEMDSKWDLMYLISPLSVTVIATETDSVFLRDFEVVNLLYGFRIVGLAAIQIVLMS